MILNDFDIMKYGAKPVHIGFYGVDCEEMLFFQYLPVKLISQSTLTIENRLKCFEEIITDACNDFIKEFGEEKYISSNIYITAKRLYQVDGKNFNRKGYHSDGFLTDDINYIWSDKNPTIFNFSDFNLTLDDKISIDEMELQADEKNCHEYRNSSLLRLNQYSIHKVNEIKESTLRTFLKVSFSDDRYDLKGNSRNHFLDYDWEMRDRDLERNIPQKLD